MFVTAVIKCHSLSYDIFNDHFYLNNTKITALTSPHTFTHLCPQ